MVLPSVPKSRFFIVAPAALPEDDQASSGRWMSLKLGTLVVSKLSMTFRQTTHFAVSPSLLGTSEGVAE
jgi:hypothetical protein